MSHKFFIIGLFLGFIFWAVESSLHVLLSGHGSLAEEFFTSEPHHLALRSFIAIVFVVFGIYAQATVNKRAKLEEELKNALRESEKRKADISALYEVSSAVSRTIETDELLSVVLKTITNLEVLNVEPAGSIFVVENDKMRLSAHLRQSAEFIDLHKNMKVGDCLCGLAAKTGDVIVCRNCEKDERHTIRCPGAGPCAHIVLPFNVKNRTIGVLCLYLPKDTVVEEEKMSLLKYMASQTGVALDNALLYEKTRELSLHDEEFPHFFSERNQQEL